MRLPRTLRALRRGGTNLPRRVFIALVTMTAVALVTASSLAPPARAGAAPRSPRSSFWFAFVTDSHLGSPQGNKWASILADDISAYGLASGNPPAFIIHGGDMTEFGTRDHYALYQESLGKVGVPLRGIPGNHESKWADAGKSSFTYALGPTFTSFDHNGVHFVLLDTSISGETYGHLEKYMLEWLKEDLRKAAGRPAVLFAHHPIGYEPKRFMDNDDDFFEAVAPYNVAAVFTGHGHSTLKWNVNGIPFFMGPAAMDGRYMIVKISGNVLSIFDKTAGSDPVEVASLGLRGDEVVPATGSSVEAGARVVYGASGAGGVQGGFVNAGAVQVEVKAALRNLAVAQTPEGAASPVRYRVDLGPWNDFSQASTQGSSRVYSARYDASSLPDGVHTLRVRAEGAAGGIWTARAEFVLDRANRGRKRILWQYGGRGGIQGTPALTRDLLIVGSSDGMMTALRRADGRVAWQFKANGSILGQPVVDGNRVYFGSASGIVYCLDAYTGVRKWYYPAESSVVGGVALSGGRLVAGTALGWVHCVDAARGRPVWKQAVGGAIRSTPAVYGGSIFTGAWDGKVYRLSLKDGNIQWSAIIDPSPYYSAATGIPLAVDRTVYVTSPANPKNGGYGVTALNIETGAIVWRSTVAAGYSDPFMHEGLLGVTTAQGNVYLLDPSTGETKKTITGGGSCLDSCAVPGPYGTFVTGTIDGRLTVLDPVIGPAASAEGGKLVDSRLVPAVQFGDGFIFSRIAISGDRAYVCTMGGRVYAVTLAR